MNKKPVPLMTSPQYSLSALLAIWKQGDGFQANIQAQLSPLIRATIDLTISEVHELNRKIRDEVAQAAFNTDRTESLKQLAEIGHFAFKRVFNDDLARSAILSALRVTPKGSVLQVQSDGFVLPWDLIYSADLTKPLSWNNFWGMQYIIPRLLVLRKQTLGYAFAEQAIAVTRPKVGLLTERALKSVLLKEIPFFNKLNNRHTINLVELRPLNSVAKLHQAEVREFIGFWKKKFHLAHFACHAISSESVFDSSIVLSDNFSISLQDMITFDLKIPNSPLIVLNGCETGNFDALFTSSIAGTFLERYA